MWSPFLLVVLIDKTQSLFCSLDVLLYLLHIVLESLHALLMIHRSWVTSLRTASSDSLLAVSLLDIGAWLGCRSVISILVRGAMSVDCLSQGHRASLRATGQKFILHNLPSIANRDRISLYQNSIVCSGRVLLLLPVSTVRVATRDISHEPVVLSTTLSTVAWLLRIVLAYHLTV